MRELRVIFQALAAAREQDKSALLATVVEVRGSTYRRAGARMLLTPDGWAAGSISGGCLESDILRRAWWRTQNGRPALVTYDSMSDDDGIHGLGMGCNGVVRVLLERISLQEADSSASLGFLRDCVTNRRAGVVATVYEATSGSDADIVGARLCLDEDGFVVQDSLRDECLSQKIGADARAALVDGAGSRSLSYNGGSAHGEVAVFLEVLVPPPSLVVVGAGHDAIPLVRLASEMLGWHVTVVDTRAAGRATSGGTVAANVPGRGFEHADAMVRCSPEEMPARVPLDERSVVVLMTHSYAQDLRLLPALLASPAPYVGVLGPRRRIERILGELCESAICFDDAQRARLFAPIGLDIGADGPEEVALSIVAEIQAFLRGRDGKSLRARRETIHKSDENSAACPSV